MVSGNVGDVGRAVDYSYFDCSSTLLSDVSVTTASHDSSNSSQYLVKTTSTATYLPCNTCALRYPFVGLLSKSTPTLYCNIL